MLFGGDDHYRSLITGKCEGAAKFAGAAFVLSELVGISCVGMVQTTIQFQQRYSFPSISSYKVREAV
jgi:hypothetical protein